MPTLCFTGMDRAEEAKFKLLFSDANEWLGGTWHLAPEAQANVLIVDLDSIYGHMTWLKAQNSGKFVIAITTRTESEAEHLLLRPVTVESLVAALADVGGGGASSPQPAAMTAAQAMSSAREAGAQEPPRPAAAQPAPAAREEPATRAAPPAAPSPQAPPPPPAAPPRAAAPPAPPRQSTTARARDPSLWDYLQAGGLPGPSRLELAGAPPLVIDPRTDTYIGGTTLKPYLPYFKLGTLQTDKWQTLSGADLNMHLAGSNDSQPLARLRWLHALVSGQGELAPGYDPGNKFRLTKWPKTEREFPKHLRIATTMMQTPGTPAEIAAKSDTPLADVNDFINASLESGFAELMNAPPSGPAAGPKTGGGLFGRLRGTR